VGEQDERSALATAAHHPPDRSPSNRGVTGWCIDYAGFDPGLREGLGEECREGFFVTGRVDALELDRSREQFGNAIFGAREVAATPREISAGSRAPVDAEK
jgi:hypothetical protein